MLTLILPLSVEVDAGENVLHKKSGCANKLTSLRNGSALQILEILKWYFRLFKF